eukprot:1375686-Rhodomonas_salina.1
MAAVCVGSGSGLECGDWVSECHCALAAARGKKRKLSALYRESKARHVVLQRVFSGISFAGSSAMDRLLLSCYIEEAGVRASFFRQRCMELSDSESALRVQRRGRLYAERVLRGT